MIKRTTEELQIFPYRFEEMIQDYQIANNWCGTDISMKDFQTTARQGMDIYGRLVNKFNTSVNGMIVEKEDSRTWMTSFLEYVNASGETDGNLIMGLGEANSTANKCEFVNNPKFKIKNYKIIAGPFIVRNDKEMRHYENIEQEVWYGKVNNFFEILEREQKSATFQYKYEIYANTFASMHKGFLGYFHFVKLGAYILFEEYHWYGDDESTRNNRRYIVKDADIAKDLEQYANDYAKKYTTFINEPVRMLDYFKTFEQETFFETFDANYLRRIRRTYAA